MSGRSYKVYDRWQESFLRLDPIGEPDSSFYTVSRNGNVLGNVAGHLGGYWTAEIEGRKSFAVRHWPTMRAAAIALSGAREYVRGALR